jgi:negative regulator of flagellin synthesis FlgM
MAMKIEQSTKLNNAQFVKEARATPAKKTESASDEVELSSVASQLAASDSEPAFDAGRVAEIRQAIAEGKFSINAEAIADRLIASAKELVGSRQQS